MTSLHRERRCAESIARLAGRHILRERSQEVDISLKAPDDLVTNVDRSTERLIVERLRESFPDDRIAGEEFGHEQGSHGGEGERTWIIDPIDGTLNFAHGVPLYCVSIGLQIEGQTRVGVIYDPNRDEMFSAAEGQGAHLNGQPMAVSDVDGLAPAVLVTGFPLGDTDYFEWTMRQFDLLTRRSRGIRRLGSAAIDLAYVAAGRLDAFWEYGLSPWDTAAGILLVTEAGGKVTAINGSPFSVDGPSIVASNGHFHTALLDALQSVV